MSPKTNDEYFEDSHRRLPKSLLAATFHHFSSGLVLLLVFGVEVAVGIFAIRDVRLADSQAERIYAGAVQGLRQTGELQYDLQETRGSMLYALTTNDDDLQVEYGNQSHAADRRVTAGIDRYLRQARIPSEVEVGRRLASDWSSYLKYRDAALGTIINDRPKEEVSVDLKASEPSFDRVRRDVDDIKRLYDEQASQQLSVVARSSRRTEIQLIAVLTFTLLFGSVSIWAVNRSRVMATLQVAKMQMDFVASISHELRTPIAAILCAGENVKDGLVQSGPDLVEQGAIIAGQANQLMDLVDQVLLFSASTRGVKLETLRPLQVSEIFQCALQNTAGLVQVKGFTVEQHIEPGLPCVTGNLSTIAQCLQNLIVNAIKFSDKDRWIGLFASLGQTRHGSTEILLSIHDHGPGIGSSELAHIFEPFYRSPQAIAAQIPGTGLGLSVAKGVAEAMGGKLSVVSEIGVGSVFTLHLPAAVRQQSQPSRVSAASNLVAR
ncbi:MAG: MCP four helix bundle domain-containing protein [Acidobacteriia bacterium]|nr:MCP four helix bundle domain-containing protein [Terriglobia bacterium]